MQEIISHVHLAMLILLPSSVSEFAVNMNHLYRAGSCNSSVTAAPLVSPLITETH